MGSSCDIKRSLTCHEKDPGCQTTLTKYSGSFFLDVMLLITRVTANRRVPMLKKTFSFGRCFYIEQQKKKSHPGLPKCSQILTGKKNTRFAQSASEDTAASPHAAQPAGTCCSQGKATHHPFCQASNQGVYSTAAAIMQSAFAIRSWQLLKYFTYPVYLERCDLNIQCLETFERKTESIRQ